MLSLILASLLFTNELAPFEGKSVFNTVNHWIVSYEVNTSFESTQGGSLIPEVREELAPSNYSATCNRPVRIWKTEYG